MSRTAIASLLLLAACSQDNLTTATYSGGNVSKTMVVGSWDRTYLVHLPTRLTTGPIAPLIIAYHGLGQTAATLETQSGFDATADAMGAIVVYPEEPFGQWDVTGEMVELFDLDEIAFTRQLIDRMASEYVIDRKRVYAVGLSNGGAYVQRLACEVADQITGFVAVAATLARPSRDVCHPSQPVSALYIIGSNDTQFPVGGDDVVLSVDSTMVFWAEQNHCDKRTARLQLPDTAGDSTHVFRSRYTGCSGDYQVELDSIAGSGHGWPGAAHPVAGVSRNLSANEEIRRMVMGPLSRPR